MKGFLLLAAVCMVGLGIFALQAFIPPTAPADQTIMITPVPGMIAPTVNETGNAYDAFIHNKPGGVVDATNASVTVVTYAAYHTALRVPAATYTAFAKYREEVAARQRRQDRRNFTPLPKL